LPADSELTASILVPLVDADQKRSAGIRRELLGSFLPWASEAELERIALELVIPSLGPGSVSNAASVVLPCVIA